MKQIEKTYLPLVAAALIIMVSFATPTQAGSDEGKNSAVYRKISQSIVLIDRLADQMVSQYGRESKDADEKKDSEALLDAMKKHRELAGDLTKASRSADKTNFRRSALAVRSNLKRIQDLSRRAKVSSSVSSLVSQSHPPTGIVVDNSGLWGEEAVSQTQPQGAYRYLLNRLRF